MTDKQSEEQGQQTDSAADVVGGDPSAKKPDVVEKEGTARQSNFDSTAVDSDSTLPGPSIPAELSSERSADLDMPPGGDLAPFTRTADRPSSSATTLAPESDGRAMFNPFLTTNTHASTTRTDLDSEVGARSMMASQPMGPPAPDTVPESSDSSAAAAGRASLSDGAAPGTLAGDDRSFDRIDDRRGAPPIDRRAEFSTGRLTLGEQIRPISDDRDSGQASPTDDTASNDDAPESLGLPLALPVMMRGLLPLVREAIDTHAEEIEKRLADRDQSLLHKIQFYVLTELRAIYGNPPIH
jgi:hypothetical protein